MKMKILKKIISIISIITILSASGCTGVLDPEGSEEEENPILAGDTTEQKPVSCMVYYIYADKYYLVGQQHLVSVPETKRAEEIFLQELIAGPKTTSNDLQPVINPNTRVVSVSDNNGLLFVTLSSHFLTPLSAVPENWQQNQELLDLVMQQRRLALYAIVNTLTQTGKYSKVQLYIDYDGSGQGERPTRAEVGFNDENGEKLLEPVGRNAQIILGPDTSVILFMQSFAEKNWEEASKYVEADNENGGEETLANEFSLLDLTLADFQVTSMTTSYDGQSAIVTIDYFIRAKDGVEYQNTNVALKVVRVDDIWKISYVSVNQLLNVSNG
jgi:hypothetical protein